MSGFAAHVASAGQHSHGPIGEGSGLMSFLGMWTGMMVAMMLPSLVPVLRRYRQAVARMGKRRAGLTTALVAAGYFFVWTIVGLAVFPLGASLAVLGTRLPALAPAVPAAAGVIVLIAGALQFTAWKERQLECCRESARHGQIGSGDAAAAVRYGLRLGFHCTCCCAGLTAVLLVSGMMDLGVMLAVTAAITFERLAPAGKRVARVTGALIVAAGLMLVARELNHFLLP